MPRSKLLPGLCALLSALYGCDDDVTVLADRCEVTVAEAAPSSGLPGDEVTLTGKPFTSTWDTAIYLGNTRAEVLSVDREGCDDCDECREDEGCTACGDCDACDALCAEECVETAQFVVPERPAGETEIRLLNSRGSSAPVAFTVLSDHADTGGDSGDSGDSGAHTGETGAHTGETAAHTGETAAHTGETGSHTGETAIDTSPPDTSPPDTSPPE